MGGPECLTLTVPEAAKVLGLGRASAYQAVRSGELPALRIGGRWVVPKAALIALLARVGEAPVGGADSGRP